MRRRALLILFSAVILFSGTGCDCHFASGKNKSAVTATRAGKQYDIPDRPVQGRIHGYAFVSDRSEIKDGVLTIRQGKKFFADSEVQIFLFTPKGSIPSGKVFRADEGNANDFNNPHVYIAWKKEGKSVPKTKIFRNNYDMYLEFGKQHGKKLPGKIYLNIPDKPATLLDGTFEADINGFILTNGKPDLTSDSFYTLEYVAEKYIKNKYPNESVRDLEYHGTMYSNPFPNRTQVGYLEATYKLKEGGPLITRIQFIKDAGGWRVFDTLRKDQIRFAHPVEPPDPKKPLDGFFDYLAAKKVEGDVQKRFPGKAIYAGISFAHCGYNPLVHLGDCKVRYRVEGQEKPVETKYLFRLTGNGWVLDRELRKTESVDYRTGTIEEQTAK